VEPSVPYQYTGKCDTAVASEQELGTRLHVCHSVLPWRTCAHGTIVLFSSERSSILFLLFLLFSRQTTRLWPTYQQSTSCRAPRAGPRSRATKRRQYRTQLVYQQITGRSSPYSEHLQAEPLSINLMARPSSQPSPTSLFLRNLQYRMVVLSRGCRFWQASSCSSTHGRQYL